MPNQSRKNFIKQIGLTGLALLAQQIDIFSQNNYAVLESSTDNVTYFKKGEADYETLRKGFNKRINNFPEIIALCKNSQGVVEAMECARNKNLKLTVKSGGHCMEGFSCLDGGMVINLSLLDKIDWIDNHTVVVEPACTLKKIYETLIPKGKYLPGGSCQSVAIGGLTLGGGYGLLSRTFGLTCDSLLEATIVTGNGTIVNTKDDPELLWAIKGGGNGNFGVVTQLKFAIHKAPATMRSYKFRHKKVSLEDARKICKQWFIQSKTLPNSCFSAFIFNGRSTYILLTNAGQNTPAVLDFIKSFEPVSTQVTSGKALPLGQALKAYYAEANPLIFKNASAGLYKRFEDIEPVIDQVFTLIKKRPGMLYQVNTLGGKIQSPAFAQSSSFAHREYNFFSELQAYWDNESASKIFLEQFSNIQNQFESAGINAQYRNYPDANFKNWAELYYGNNLNRLLAVKLKYDPKNIFGGMQTLSV